MSSLEIIKNKLTNHKKHLQNQYRVEELGLFGSYVRGDQHAESDIDILIDYKKPPTLFMILELEDFLTDLLESPVDLVTKKGIKPQLKPYILNEVIYL